MDAIACHQSVTFVLSAKITYTRSLALSSCHPRENALVGNDPFTRRIAIYHRGTGFGRQVGDGAARVAGQLGVEVSVSSTLAEVAAADMLLVAGRFADETAAAERLLPGGWRAGAAARLARAPPDRGTPPTGLHRRLPATPPRPAVLPGGTADHDLLAAAADLDCVTLFGRFALDPATGAQTGHQVITIQWQDGIRRAVWPPGQAQSPVRIPLPQARTSIQAIPPAGQGDG